MNRQLITMLMVFACVQFFCQDLMAQQLPVRRFSGLTQGVNFGNMLEAPAEGDWGLFAETIYFDRVKQAGFDHIRLPVSWTHHADLNAPYTIDPQFMDRVKWCVQQAELRGLKIIVNNHHYAELNANPIAEWSRALAIWQQIATEFRDHSSRVYFEILNEPHGVFTEQPELWNEFVIDALAVIRATNPKRRVLVGPTRWNSIGALATFNPPIDPYLILTIHYYEPFGFTHQGAEWINPIPPLGVIWTGTRLLIAGGYEDWSWGQVNTPTDNGLRVVSNSGWSSVYARNDNTPIVGATKLQITVDRALSLRLVVGDDVNIFDYFLETGAGTNTYVIDLPPGLPPAKLVWVQNATSDPAGEFLISRLDLIADKRYNLLKRESNAPYTDFGKAAEWANNRKMALYLGEFGSYQTGDLASRVAWTRFIRSQATRLNIGFGYWEFGAGMGIYDPVNDQFRLPLLQALLPNYRE